MTSILKPFIQPLFIRALAKSQRYLFLYPHVPSPYMQGNSYMQRLKHIDHTYYHNIFYGNVH